MQQVTIYTDGSCLGNPGPGGWAAVLMHGSRQREMSGGEKQTTNNRMELMAAIQALNTLKRPCRVCLHTDSAYLCNAFRKGWLKRWQANGWRTSKRLPVENQDLWQQLLDLTQRHEVEWVKVQGHANDLINERCDELARAASKAAAESP